MSPASSPPVALAYLRRVVAAVARLRGRQVQEVTVRSDLRHVKVELDGGLILVISAEHDEQGRPHLEVDVVEQAPDTAARQQIEVSFD
ncbi:MAG TPA: hypothetical protein VMH88_00030 [Gemmatimonadales bacterium]|nr:hypothetical protein [Gemmatimonadales bacterium]